MLDLTNVQEQTGFTPIPQGKYLLVVDEVELKDTKSGEGKYLKTTIKVVDGKFQNRVIFHNFNIANPNAEAVQIGLGQIKALMRLAGKTNFVLQSPSELCGLRAWGNVAVRKDERGENNVIKGFVEAPEQTGGFVPGPTAPDNAPNNVNAFGSANNNDVPF